MASCGTPRKVPQGKFLLHQTKITGIKPNYRDGATNYIRQKPNTKFLGIQWLKLGLGVYNNFSWKNDKGFSRWIRTKLGEEPVVYDSLAADYAAQQIELYLQNKGFFNAEVQYATRYKKRKAYVEYKAVPKDQYKIRNIHYIIPDKNIQTIYFYSLAASELKMDAMYDLALIDAERERLARLLRNHGYFYFNREYIYFTLDTALNTSSLDLYINITQPDNGAHRAYNIATPQVQILPPEEFRKKKKIQGLDTAENVVISDPLGVIKHKIVRQMIFLEEDKLFTEKDVELSYSRLGDLGMFRFVNIDFQVDPNDSTKLSPQISLNAGKRRFAQFELEGYVASENLGSSINFVYRDKNIFGGAEIFEFKVKAGVETQTFIDQNTGNVPIFNSTETNTSLSITFPGFVFFRDKKTIGLYASPKTRVGINFINEARPEYFRNTLSGSFTYDWKQNQRITHSLSPAVFNIVNSILSEEALIALEDLNNQYIKESFDPHITLGSRYTFAYSNQVLNRTKNYFFFRFNVEMMGTGLYAISRFQDKEKTDKGEYTFFKVPYFNYTRPEIDIRYFNFVRTRSILVYRLAAGVGFSYWNSEVLPFERQFYTGGSNSLRAFRARSVGPGAFANINTSNLNLDQTGEMKIEGNMEYRFDLIDRFIGSKLKGATFIDMGNVWLISDASTATNPAGEFKWNRFLSELAIGTGMGLRLDYSFLLFRFDVGLKVRDPRFVSSDRWVITRLNDEPWKSQNQYSFWNFNFGIGYPF